jgi:hypothetical protein
MLESFPTALISGDRYGGSGVCQVYKTLPDRINISQKNKMKLKNCDCSQKSRFHRSVVGTKATVLPLLSTLVCKTKKECAGYQALRLAACFSPRNGSEKTVQLAEIVLPIGYALYAGQKDVGIEVDSHLQNRRDYPFDRD